MRRATAVAIVSGAALALVVVLNGCGTPAARAGRSAEPGWIVTQIPAGLREDVWAGTDALALDERYPAGSRIVFVPSETAGTADPRVLTGDLVAAGAPAPTRDGDAVLFAGKATETSHWAIYRVDLDAPGPRPLLELDGDCGDPRVLAHDRVVAACTTPERRSTSSLYTASIDGSNPERITFGPGSALDPLPLPDGRILFSMEQRPGPGRHAPATLALFTLNPDGTMLEPFSGSHRPAAHKRRARPTADGGVVYLSSERPGGGRAVRVEMSRPHAAPTEAWPGALAVAATAVEPLPDGGYLVADRAIRRVTADGRVTRVFDTEAWDEVEAISTRAAAPLRGRPSGRRPGQASATLICYDARRGDGEVGPTKNLAAATHGVAIQVLGRDAVDLGLAPVHEDGSFHVEVPTDVPIRVRTLDSEGEELSRSDWFWMRPGEVRACFGCHEKRGTAPVNRTVAALAVPPVELR